MQTFMISNKTVSVFTSFKPETPIIYLNTFSGEGQKIYEAAQAAGCPPFTLVAVSDLDWNHDMAPWDSPPTFKNAFLAGGASPGTRWPGCSLCTPSTRRICFPGWAACLAPSGFPA